MIALAVLCALLIGCLGWGFWMHLRAMADAAEERETLLEKAADERASLLERIQRPEIRQVKPVADTIVIPPHQDDSNWIGMEVPDYMKVGTVDESSEGR